MRTVVILVVSLLVALAASAAVALASDSSSIRAGGDLSQGMTAVRVHEHKA